MDPLHYEKRNNAESNNRLNAHPDDMEVESNQKSKQMNSKPKAIEMMEGKSRTKHLSKRTVNQTESGTIRLLKNSKVK